MVEADIALMRCPRCRGPLSAVAAALRCERCQATFETAGGIPNLLPWSGAAPGVEWKAWREKLEGFQEWRRATWDGSARSVTRQKLADDLATEFFKFARVPEGGAVLEIGCGSGELKRFVPRRRYWGLDPLLGVPGAPAVATTGDVFIRGVGECLPLADESFQTVLVCETLDHALDPPLLIREARRVLKEGGLLAVMQNVRLAMPPPSLAVRMRAAAGRLRSRLAGRAPTGDAATKMRAIGQDELSAMVGAEMMVESGMTRGAVMCLRALKQDLSAPRPPKRAI